MGILKLTAKKAPFATLAAFLVYVIFSKVIEVNQSGSILVAVVGLTFVISLSLLIYGSRNQNSKQTDKVEPSDSSISKVKTGRGDVFIGNKDTEHAQISPKRSKIKEVEVETGDVFIGTKKSIKDE